MTKRKDRFDEISDKIDELAALLAECRENNDEHLFAITQYALNAIAYNSSNDYVESMGNLQICVQRFWDINYKDEECDCKDDHPENDADPNWICPICEKKMFGDSTKKDSKKDGN